MFDKAYIGLVWRNNRTFAIFSTVLISLLQFLILYLVTTFDTQAMLSAILDQMPPLMKTFLEDSFFSMLTYDGAASFGFNHPIVLTLLVLNAILIPAHHITRELESGTMELLMAHPFRRRSLLVSLWVSGSMILLFIIAFALAASISSILLFHELTTTLLVRLVEICINLWLLMVLVFSYTLLIAVFSKMGIKAGNISAIITFFFYLLYYLSQLWHKLSFTQPYNIFNYYNPQETMTGQGSYLLNIAVLFVLVALVFIISLRQFQRRDIP